MKKLIIAIWIIFISGISFFIACNPDEQDLGDHYYYIPKYEAVDVGYPGGGIIYKSQQKNLFSDIKIRGNVVQTRANKNFIVAIQNADTSYLENKSSKIEEKLPVQYFIIAKRDNKIYGPFTKEEYLSKRHELSVPENLELKE